MTHEQALAGDVVDGYVTGRLSEQDRAAFEAHMFTCDECFAEVQAADKLRDGVRALARRGGIDTAVPAPLPLTTPPASAAARYAPWLALAATLVIATTSYLSQQRRYEELRGELDGVRDRHGALQQELDRARTDLAERSRVTPEANVPVAILQSVRSGGTGASITLPRDATRLVLWIEDPPQSVAGAVMTLSDSTGRVVAELGDLRPNAQGAVVAAFPSASLATGAYTVRVSAGGGTLAEYPLSIAKLR